MSFINNLIKNLNLIPSKATKLFTKDDVAELLKVSPDALQAFEESYWEVQKQADSTNTNFFKQNSRMVKEHNLSPYLSPEATVLAATIVEELLVKYGYKKPDTDLTPAPVTVQVIETLPDELKPQFTAHLLKKEIAEDSYIHALDYYQKFINTGKQDFYMRFLQGLDILDLDPIMYEILGCNQNAMGHWFPQLKTAVEQQEFFKVPETKIIKVPLPILQLTRLPYESLTPTTLKIVDDFCMEAFNLDVTKDYFIKTGTYSSKFDFRNAVVRGEQEVRELGEYLLYIHHQANQMASMFNNVSIPGVSTTNEWVVREYIPDKEDNPCIYKGMPLHTEYRFFIDFDTNEILGVSPYWREDVMKKNLGESDEPDKVHDYIIYTAYEDELYKRYDENIDMLTKKVQNFIPTVDLKGQWSLDVMQNGSDFWLIDMALANQSALTDVVPPHKLKKQMINWLPTLPTETHD